jgi:FkbM family methyltransferase
VSPRRQIAVGGDTERNAGKEARRAAKKQARQAAPRDGAPAGARRRTKRQRSPGDKRGTAASPVAHAEVSSTTPDPEARTRYFEEARDHTPYLGVETDDGRFVVATRSRGMGRHLFSKQGRPEFRVLRRAVTAVEALSGDGALTGRLFIDVGANIGTSTVSALVSHQFGSAVCCEPEEENYRLLRANLALNDLEQVRSLRVAVSNQVGSGDLVVTGGPSGKTWIALDAEKIRDAEARRAARAAEDPGIELPELTVVPNVELVTLDGLTKSGVIDIDVAGMLWIDAEGHEGHILDGAGSLVDVGLPVVFEFDPEVLERRGNSGMVNEVAQRCYTHFVDLRRQEPDRHRFALRPIGDLPELGDRLLGTGRFTDLLLLRLDPRQAMLGENLPELMVERSERRSAGRV